MDKPMINDQDMHRWAVVSKDGKHFTDAYRSALRAEAAATKDMVRGDEEDPQQPVYEEGKAWETMEKLGYEIKRFKLIPDDLKHVTKAEHLNDMSTSQLMDWIRGICQGHGYLFGSRGDENYWLPLSRIFKQLPPETLERVNVAVLQLMFQMVGFKSQDIDYNQNILRLIDELKYPTALTYIKGHLESSFIFDDVPVMSKKQMLGIMIDNKVQMKDVFWPYVFDINKDEYGTLAISAMLDIDIYKAFNLIRKMDDSEDTAGMLSLILELAYGKASDNEKFAILGKMAIEAGYLEKPVTAKVFREVVDKHRHELT